MQDSDHTARPGEENLARLAVAINPGSRISNCVRLSGGIDNATFRLTLLDPNGETQSLTLRRHRGWSSVPAAEKAGREWQVLELLQRIGVSAPRPVFNDSDGAITGHPSLVLSYLEGGPDLTPVDSEVWARTLARPIAELHARTAGFQVRSFLPDAEDSLVKTRLNGPSEREAAHAQAQAVWAELKYEFDRLENTARCVVHFDYYAGNTIWLDGNFEGIIDWDGASICVPAYDVAYMRMDMCLQGRFHESNVFVAEYERISGRTIKNLRYYELLACLRAMPDPGDWLPGWNSFGANLTVEEVRNNLSIFTEQTLSRRAN